MQHVSKHRQPMLQPPPQTTPLHGGDAAPQPRRGAPSWLLTRTREAVPPVRPPPPSPRPQHHHHCRPLREGLEPGRHPAVQRLAGHPAVTVPNK